MFYPVLRGMCSAGLDGTEYIKDFQFVESIACTYADAAGGLVVVGMIFYGGIALSLYISTDDVRIPVVLTLLTGGAVISQVAAPAVTIIAVALLLTGAGVLTLLYYRFSR